MHLVIVCKPTAVCKPARPSMFPNREAWAMMQHCLTQILSLPGHHQSLVSRKEMTGPLARSSIPRSRKFCPNNRGHLYPELSF
jgi:hypothetical protein